MKFEDSIITCKDCGASYEYETPKKLRRSESAMIVCADCGKKIKVYKHNFENLD
jgi:transcription elongation factor Elf1